MEQVDGDGEIPGVGIHGILLLSLTFGKDQGTVCRGQWQAFQHGGVTPSAHVVGDGNPLEVHFANTREMRLHARFAPLQRSGGQKVHFAAAGRIDVNDLQKIHEVVRTANHQDGERTICCWTQTNLSIVHQHVASTSFRLQRGRGRKVWWRLGQNAVTCSVLAAGEHHQLISFFQVMTGCLHLVRIISHGTWNFDPTDRRIGEEAIDILHGITIERSRCLDQKELGHFGSRACV
mmetsp:Transcript_68243/g.107227  ORF Transcript_68243/g.107227 Transcript_68243/m.107227 type:complete len:234 (-) Transcript_68243:478-1179(-)